MNLVGFRPWRMSATDYLAAVRPDGLPLTGSPVTPCWDDHLRDAMRGHGVAVHEETVLDTLLVPLRTGDEPGAAPAGP